MRAVTKLQNVVSGVVDIENSNTVCGTPENALKSNSRQMKSSKHFSL